MIFLFSISSFINLLTSYQVLIAKKMGKRFICWALYLYWFCYCLYHWSKPVRNDWVSWWEKLRKRLIDSKCWNICILFGIKTALRRKCCHLPALTRGSTHSLTVSYNTISVHLQRMKINAQIKLGNRWRTAQGRAWNTLEPKFSIK